MRAPSARFVIEGPDGRAEVGHPSAKAVLSQAQGLAVNHPGDAAWQVLELPLVGTGSDELLFVVEKKGRVIETRMVNE